MLADENEKLRDMKEEKRKVQTKKVTTGTNNE